MVIPVAEVYGRPSGGANTRSRVIVPSWVAKIPVDTWYQLTNTKFSTWAMSAIPSAGYRGTNPIASIINAYCDPAIGDGAHYFFGGGHGDGTCNAVVKFDHHTLAYSLVGSPTDPVKYPPKYYVANSSQVGDPIYPSGFSGGGFFCDNKILTNPLDLGYATKLARCSTHMYAAAAMRGSVIHYFYHTYAEFDTVTGNWSGHGVNIGAQLNAISTNFGSTNLQQGTVAMYDEVTDRFFVTLNPGDAGGGWRNGVIVFNPGTRQIEQYINFGRLRVAAVGNSMNVVRVGRKLYMFNKTGVSSARMMNQGFILDMDTLIAKAFVLSGDTAGTVFSDGAWQETIPSWYDGRAIRRWNYSSLQKQNIFSVDPTPVSGVGTGLDPLVLTQNVRTLSGTPPANPTYIYKRFAHFGAADCAVVLPKSDSDWFAIKLS